MIGFRSRRAELGLAAIPLFLGAQGDWPEAYPVDSGCFQVGSYGRCNGR